VILEVLKISGALAVLAGAVFFVLHKLAARHRARRAPGLMPTTFELNVMFQDLRAGRLKDTARLFRGCLYQGLVRAGYPAPEALRLAADPSIRADKVRFRVSYQ
jgi:hypothetical protein